MKITVEQLKQTILSILIATPIYGAKDTSDYVVQKIRNGGWGVERPIALHLNWERAWGVGASLNISVQIEDGMQSAYGGPTPCKYFRTTCDIGWSSTGRDVQAATAALALYRQVVDLAALIEAATDGVKVETEEKEAAK